MAATTVIRLAEKISFSSESVDYLSGLAQASAEPDIVFRLIVRDGSCDTPGVTAHFDRGQRPDDVATAAGGLKLVVDQASLDQFGSLDVTLTPTPNGPVLSFVLT